VAKASKTTKAQSPAKGRAPKHNANGHSILVIVESPAKAKTIEKYLGPGHTVRASMGHVRDLPERDLGIDPANGFEPVYQVLPGRVKVVSELKKLAAKADLVYLATDLDREGEAIAWHLASALQLDPEKTRRVVFNEITKSAVAKAFESPRGLDMNKVDAQQARRILDRLVGYELSPLLWTKIAKGLSAGRVQSVAVRLVVEREWEIRAFRPTESWRIGGVFTPQRERAGELSSQWQAFLESGEDPDSGRPQKERTAWLNEHQAFQAELIRLGGREFQAGTCQEAVQVAESLGFALEETEEHVWEEYAKYGLKTVDVAGQTRQDATEFTVTDVQTKRTSSRPSGPFTTATLQQAAASQLRFGATRTMKVAQQLYEGVELGAEGSVGLITYMRSDSLNLSQEAVGALRELIEQRFGKAYLPAEPNAYASRKRAQEAHEAIRPAQVSRTPESIKAHVTSEQYRLYELIWKRAVACQMAPAVWDSTTVLLEAPIASGPATFKGTGRVLIFDGHLKVAGSAAANADQLLPKLTSGTPLAALEIDPEQSYTSAPPRYSEAALIKTLEAQGIGRPSTYAPIIQTIQDRGYVEQIDRRLHATDKGEIVTEKLLAHFPEIMDLKFTSHMEDELDKIEEDHLEMIQVLREFYEPFKASLTAAQSDMVPARMEPSEFTCQTCGKPMVYRWARTGRFLSCTGYPECRTAHNVDREGKPIIAKVADHACEVCGRPMLLRQSRHGHFLGCSAYPKCTHTIPCTAEGTPHKLVDEKQLETPCEACGEGTLVVKRRGWRSFLGCNRYPKCKTTQPLPEGVRLERKAAAPPEEAGVDCQRCGRPMLIRVGKRGKFVACSGFPRCRNTLAIEKLEAAKANPQQAQKAARTPIRNSGGAVARSADDQAPPLGYAWTRTGKPTVEVWPEEKLFCPQCGSEMNLKAGRWGPFFSCSGFPRCKFTANLRGAAKKRAEEIMPPAPPKPKPIPTDIKCEECGSPMLVRKGRSGEFLGCSGFPKCRATSPLPEGFVIPEPVEQR
jgi:DNA topoisomerase-1